MRKKFKIFRLRQEGNNPNWNSPYLLRDDSYISSLEFEYIGDAENELKDNVLFDEKYVILEVYSAGND